MFKKILIANRGEIAVRVVRACREMGIIPVAVYSDVDRAALHVRLAQEAYPLGGSSPAETYLDIEKLLAVARSCGAEAVHPGYGFLAENARFVERCEQEGIIFIGPPSRPMDLMGRKTTSRRVMSDAGVPIIPGTLEPVRDESELGEAAEEIGYPVLLKASGGGGGKGLRLVRDASELSTGFRLARSEAESSFADPAVYIEKYIDRPHHIEVQILADHHGRTVYLGERECSLQRRYQKVLEETPSPFIDDETRRRMGETAVRAASSIGYRNAGTVEFIVDARKNFYFLEMNARLQVEHPVTEMVTGIDLVRMQFDIAAGLPLEIRQEDIRPQGCALECRIYAEDPDNDFLPSPGRILHLHTPAGGLGIREDSGIYEGCTVPFEYDPLLAKLIAWGKTREEAVGRMLRALSEYRIYGIKTTVPFFRRILTHARFLGGDYTTHFIAEMDRETGADSAEEKRAAVLASGLKRLLDARRGPGQTARSAASAWKIRGRAESHARSVLR
ncbi:MAG: pyruvate carboxylase subunit A [Candidatus Aminicenantes bacterium RBG_13_62_12]|nr:MAG: pyruvate carboxylase subunit A [Candidatus Aminicenantes bacterium RBG_13_62_12]